MPPVIIAEAGARDEALEAAMPAAIAGWPGNLADVGARQRVVAPFAGARVRAGMGPAVDGDAGAGAGADDDGEDHAMSAAGAVGRFRHGQAVGVVVEAHGAAEGGLEIALHR